MGRNKRSARRRVYAPLTLKELCRMVGINPRQRIIIGRYLRNMERK